MAEEEQSGNGSNGDAKQMVLSALRSKELLVPAALSAAGAVAAAKGPDILRRVTSSTEEKGEEEAQRLGKKATEGAKDALGGGLAGKMLSKAVGGGAGGTKKTRRLPIQRWTDVAVPIDKAYEAWTKFDEFPRFMHRVLDAKKEGRDRVRWQEKIWFSKRQWEGQITDRRKNDRIAWKTTSGMSHHGVVTFHKLDDRLTRVMVDMEFEPNGMIEKMASGLRFVKRAVQADLARFKAYVEMEDAKGIQYRDGQENEQQDDSREDGNSGDDAESDRRERQKRREERRKSLSSK